MLRSSERILTTHAGSLPRPEHLTSLFVRRARGEGICANEIAAAGHAALRAIVPKQVAAGIDIGNNGEQQREGFFLYLRHRMSGIGGSWQRRPAADVEHYPLFRQARQQFLSGREAVSNFQPPKAIGDVRYRDAALIESECDDFRAVLDEGPAFVEPFLTAPSPGIVASAVRNEH